MSSERQFVHTGARGKLRAPQAWQRPPVRRGTPLASTLTRSGATKRGSALAASALTAIAADFVADIVMALAPPTNGSAPAANQRATNFRASPCAAGVPLNSDKRNLFL